MVEGAIVERVCPDSTWWLLGCWACLSRQWSFESQVETADVVNK